MNQKSATTVSIIEERINIPVAGQQFAQLVRIHPVKDPGPAVFMLHGLMDDARCFHDSQARTGLAYVLARQGYDVYMGELRSRRLDGSTLKKHPFGVEDAINQDLHRLVEAMNKRIATPGQIWIGQGFGSLLLTSYLARHPAQLQQLRGMVHFSPFRESQPAGRIKHFWVNWLHRRGISLVSRLLGYVPAVRFKLGRCNESLNFYQDVLYWLDSPWRGKDGFDYAAAVKQLDWPPSLYFASLYQSWRGSDADARAFMFDLGAHNGRLIKLGRRVGNHKNYRRSELCLHEAAEQDYFPLLLDWLKELPEHQATSGQ
ncbi:alpha/beta hydrolase [Marinospirillum alkaliphilum]|uniref:Serine aminopeptidase, S33 n=1 Tax=Marinospirillum alkaliphilum DSM 21637 TaxID=1122209 RepID=A0A1K1TZ08_9GAMM|nr:alpha/beta hydrolase [Marinospirillum alkaliphilum]SFX05752.1 Serine aminopeptidase, S33 [Marinospirillum alkaliphilum DSM 21637]